MKRLRARHVLLWSAGLLTGIYLAHPLILKPVLIDALESAWTGEVECGVPFILPNGSVWLSRLGLSYTREGRTEELVRARGILVNPSVRALLRGDVRINSVSVRELRVAWEKEALAFFRKSEGPPAPESGQAQFTGSLRGRIRRAGFSLGGPDGFRAEETEVRFSLRYGRELRVSARLFNPLWESGTAECAVTDGGRETSLKFAWKGARIGPEARAVLPKEWHRYWDDYDARGKADLELGLDFRAGEPVPDFTINARLRGARSRIPGVGVPLEEADALVRWAAGRLEIRNAAGTLCGSPVRFAVTVDFPAHELKIQDVEATRMRLTPGVALALPLEMRPAWNRIAPSGAVSLTKGNAIWKMDSGELTASLHLQTEDLAFQVGKMAIGGIHGELAGEITRKGPTEAVGGGTLSILKMNIGPVVLESCQAPWTYRADPGDSALVLGPDKIKQLQFRCAQGTLIGTTEVHFAPQNRLAGYLTAEGISLEHLIAQLRASEPSEAPLSNGARKIEGIVTGKIRLTQAFDNADSLEGSGDLEIHHGSLGQVPTLGGIFKYLVDQKIGTDTLSDLTIPSFKIEPDKVVVEDFRIPGSTLAFWGNGKIRYGGMVDLNIIAGPPGDWFGAGIVKLFSSLLTGFTAFELKGPWTKPELKVLPMRAGEHLKSFLGLK